MKSYKIIYIAGPITGKIDDNRPAFAAAEKYLREQFPDAEIINPVYNFGRIQMSQEVYMRRSAQQLAISTHIYVLEGWEESKGACWEVNSAKVFGVFTAFQVTKEHYLTNTVVDAVSNAFGLAASEWLSDTRREPHVTARQMYMYWLYQHEDVTLQGVMRFVFGKAHGTAITAKQKIEKLLKNNAAAQNKYRVIDRELAPARDALENIKWRLQD